MRFETANMSGSYDWIGTHLLITIDGSGPMSERGLQNDWWRTNFFAIPLFAAHAGYTIAALRIAKLLGQQIVKATSVSCVGHSLGGAVAEVLAVGIGARGKRAFARNYGGPRVWRTKWWALFADGRADITWYSAGTDIVPWVPPWLYHAGKHIHVKTGMWNPVKNHLEGYDAIRRG